LVGFAGVTAIEVSVGVMIMLKGLVAVFAGMLVSVACTVKLEVPAVIGVPAMTPLVALNVRPGGSKPLTTDQE
jgi:hypothetical protein